MAHKKGLGSSGTAATRTRRYLGREDVRRPGRQSPATSSSASAARSSGPVRARGSDGTTRSLRRDPAPSRSGRAASAASSGFCLTAEPYVVPRHVARA